MITALLIYLLGCFYCFLVLSKVFNIIDLIKDNYFRFSLILVILASWSGFIAASMNIISKKINKT